MAVDLRLSSANNRRSSYMSAVFQDHIGYLLDRESDFQKSSEKKITSKWFVRSR